MSSKKVTFKLDKKAFGRVLKSPELMKTLEGYAQKYTDADHHVKSFVGWDRDHVNVYENTKENPG